MPSMPDMDAFIPHLDTERLTLHGPSLDDFAEWAAMWADAAVTRYIGGRPFSAQEVWARLIRDVGHWALLGFGYWTVRERLSGRFVGAVGLADYRREIDPPLGAPESGWVLSPWAHGQGFATEAVRAALAWADIRFDYGRTVCLIDRDNEPSMRVAVKCGYHEFHRTLYSGGPVVLFERDPHAQSPTSQP